MALVEKPQLLWIRFISGSSSALVHPPPVSMLLRINSSVTPNRFPGNSLGSPKAGQAFCARRQPEEAIRTCWDWGDNSENPEITSVKQYKKAPAVRPCRPKN